jgi:hypothetical protein
MNGLVGMRKIKSQCSISGMNGHVGIRKIRSQCLLSEMDAFDLSGLLDNPRLNIERQRSVDDSLLGELSIGARSFSSAQNSFEPQPMLADAWESLRKSLVYFNGKPVGTLAAVDHQSEEVLNYDQVSEFLNPY